MSKGIYRGSSKLKRTYRVQSIDFLSLWCLVPAAAVPTIPTATTEETSARAGSRSAGDATKRAYL